MTDVTAADDTVYRKRISVQAPPATVFELLTDPDRLRRWQSVVSSVDLSVGGDYRHVIVPGAVAIGSFVEVVPDERLVYTWGWDGNDGVPPGSSTVTVELRPDGNRTIIDFTHAGLPDESARDDHGHGWDHFIERLAVAAETGDAGWNPWAAGPDDLDLLGAAEASAALLLETARSMTAEDLEQPTPCAAFTVADLLDHLEHSLTALAGVAGSGGGVEDGPPVDRAAVGAEPALAIVATDALTAWRDRGLDGEVDFAGDRHPATVPAAVLLMELFVHGWDLSQALGRPFEPAPQLVALADDHLRAVIPPVRGDAFAPPLPEEGLDDLAAVMAFTGRAQTTR